MNGSVIDEESDGGMEDDWLIEETREERKNEREMSRYNRTLKKTGSLWETTPGTVWKIVYKIFGSKYTEQNPCREAGSRFTAEELPRI